MLLVWVRMLIIVFWIILGINFVFFILFEFELFGVVFVGFDLIINWEFFNLKVLLLGNDLLVGLDNLFEGNFWGVFVCFNGLCSNEVVMEFWFFFLFENIFLNLVVWVLFNDGFFVELLLLLIRVLLVDI